MAAGDFEELCAFVLARLDELDGVDSIRELVEAQRGLVSRMRADGSRAATAHQLVRVFAQEFADHDDFRPEWGL